MSDKPLIIPVSFKNTIEDIELYNWVVSHSNKSGFIKDILKRVKSINLDKNI